jgi:glycosyltransferase involved in cell wall biosynthesis
MTATRVALLVNAGPSSIEAVRARGLAQNLPSDQVLYLFREGGRWASYQRWNREMARFQPDVIYVLNTALPGVPLACRWSRRTGIPFILDTGDAIVEMARRSGIGAGWRLPILRWLEGSGLRRAHTVVVRGTRHRELLQQQGVQRVELIRDGYAPQSSVQPETVAALRRRLGLDGRRVVGLMGSLVFSPRLQICYGWDLVGALPLLADLPVTALVIGDGDGLEWLRGEARRLGVLERLVFTGRIPYAEVPTYLRLMDIALSTQTNNLPGQVRTTGKLPEYMAAERFILASRVGEAALILPEPMLLDYEGEVDRGYPGRLAERIRHLHLHPDVLELRHELPAKVQKLCAYDVLARRFVEVIAAAHANR